MCVLRLKASFVLLTSVDSTAIVTTGGKGGGDRERRKVSLSVSCFIITLCRIERRFITIPVFGGYDKDEGS